MRRCICIFLSVCMLLLSGCGIFGARIREPVTFHYLSTSYLIGEESEVFGTERRESAGHRQELSYLLTLYLLGPSDSELRSPLPRGTAILRCEQDANGHVTLELSDTTKNMSDIGFSLACTCLTLTCMELVQTDQVTVISGQRTMTMGPDSLILYDNATAVEETK